MTTVPEANSSIIVAKEALVRGYQPVPIRKGSKAPRGGAWTQRRFTEETVEQEFADVESVGLVLGEVSGNLVDVDLDHPIAWRVAPMFLPPTPMRHGRVGNPNSHYWYRITDEVKGYRKYTLPGGETTVELRASSGHQTLIPPSIWYPDRKKSPGTKPEVYRWEGEAWGGDAGPTEMPWRQLAVRVASLALATVLIENWPKEGSRHDAYLALAGGMLRFGREGLHPYWEQALPQLIEVLAEATHDDDGGDARVGEVIPSTIAKIKVGARVNGWTTLEGIIGTDSVRHAKTLVTQIEEIVDWKKFLPLPSTNEPMLPQPEDHGGEGEPEEADEEDGPAVVEVLNPLDVRRSTWEVVGLEPYLAGEIVVPDPTILRRTDGQGLMYPGRVNSLYGKSESAKSWVACGMALQEIGIGERVLYIDLEDDPAMLIARLRRLGAGDDDVRYQFRYIRPEGPLATMQRDRWGNDRPSEVGHKNLAYFEKALDDHEPGLVIVDGMSVLYGLHNLDTNDVTSTDIITQWLKAVTKNGRRTVVIIDHTGKGAEKGAAPIGSQHKISMVQGTAIQVAPVIQPRPGVLGHVELVIGKDRPGGVRAVSSDEKNQVAADVFLDSREEGVTLMTISPPKKADKDHAVVDGTKQPTRPPKRTVSTQERLAQMILDLFTEHPGEMLTSAQIRATIGYDVSPSTYTRAIEQLMNEGHVVKEGSPPKGPWYRLDLPDV